MSPSPIIIEAVVHPAERSVLAAASGELADCLSRASDTPYSVTLEVADALGANGPHVQRRAIRVASLLLEMPGRAESLSDTAARWRGWISALGERDIVSTFVCTIFRHVAGRADASVIERIRRLNLLATELSHDTGVNVVDIDRALAFVGARALRTDYRLGGAAAAKLAAHIIVSSILMAGLDDFFPPETQERAKEVLRAMIEGTTPAAAS